MGNQRMPFYSCWEGTLFDLLNYSSPSSIILAGLELNSPLNDAAVFNTVYDTMHTLLESKFKDWSHILIQIGDRNTTRSLTLLRCDNLVATVFNLLHNVSIGNTLEDVQLKLYSHNLKF